MQLFVVLLLVACATAVPPQSFPRPNLFKNLGPTSRIIDGKEAERYQFPYQVSVRMILFGIVKHICSGTLISDRWVLTAGQCREGVLADYEVALGMLIQKEEHKDVQIIKVKKFILHPEYPPNLIMPHDIGLLELETPATLGPAVQIAPLPQGLDECNILEDAYFTGWGLTNTWFPPIFPRILHWAILPRITNEDCGKALAQFPGIPDPFDDTMICTGQRPGQRETMCTADGGGPLVLTSGTVVGVASFTINPCGSIDAPTVYTSVCKHLDFIHKYI